MDECQNTLSPVLFAAGAAAVFAIGIQFARLGLRTIDSMSGTLITIAVGTVLYWALSPLYVLRDYWFTSAAGLFVLIGVFRPVLSANLAMAGTRYLGPTICTTLAGTAPLFALVLGASVLGEGLTAFTIFGACAVVTGVVVLSWRGGVRLNWPLWAVLLPIGAALLRTGTHLLAKLGMEELPSPFFVGLVGYTVSLVLAVGLSYARGKRPWAIMRTPGSQWFLYTGVLYAGAVYLLNVALECGDLVVVAPVVAAEPVFALLLGWWVFHEETLTRRTIIGVLIVVFGIVLVTARDLG